ncbi:MAG TPA: hypothetical protein GXZ28_08800 [Clostridiales bacterium]|jgi:hypothetical protein|nr:hypothetical protein [Clostridiales bacterium]
MLYTARPLERVYADMRKYDKRYQNSYKNTNETTDMEYRDVVLPHGRVVTRREGENYIIQKINSTDMGDYLNDEYSPGKVFKN